MTATVPTDITPAAAPFSARLREATRGDHRAAESSDYFGRLMSGGLAREGYAALVAQHWFIYQVLEEAADVMRADPVVGAFVDDRLHRVPALRADLAFLVGPDWADRIAPSRATTAYRDRLREVCFTWPAGFLAHHYTRYLGDLSGGQAIGKVTARHYGLRDGRGVAFYDFTAIGSPAEYKAGYRAKLDALPYDETELSRMVDEVAVAYRLNTAVFEELARDTERYADPFPPQVVRQITRHMNDDHAADSLLIVRRLAGLPAATAARMTGMDADGIEFAATVDGVEVPVRLPFSRRLAERAEVRPEVVRMYREAKGGGSEHER